MSGSASYNGVLSGFSNETYSDSPWDYGDAYGRVTGSIMLAFDFGAGSLSGSISPTVYNGQDNPLGTIVFKNTIYSPGSTTFSGAFDINLPGANSFSGQFTGPTAQELIGSFALPYISRNDGKSYDAAGAFVGKR